MSTVDYRRFYQNRFARLGPVYYLTQLIFFPAYILGMESGSNADAPTPIPPAAAADPFESEPDSAEPYGAQRGPPRRPPDSPAPGYDSFVEASGEGSGSDDAGEGGNLI